MHPICSTLDKKLFSFLATLWAIACHSNLSAGNLETFSFGDISFDITSQRVLKFNDLATADTYQVVMFGRWLNLVAMV